MATKLTKYAELEALFTKLTNERNWTRKFNDPWTTMRQDVFWFISLERADTASSQYSRSELATLFLNGLRPMDEADVEGWLEEQYIDFDHLDEGKRDRYVEITNALMEARILKYFGLISNEEHEEAFEKWRSDYDDMMG